MHNAQCIMIWDQEKIIIKKFPESGNFFFMAASDRVKPGKNRQ